MACTPPTANPLSEDLSGCPSGAVNVDVTSTGDGATVAMAATAPTTQLRAEYCTGLDDYFLSDQLQADVLSGASDDTAQEQTLRSLSTGMDLTLFPNPNDGRNFIIELGGMDDLEGLVTFTIHDGSGRLVHSEAVGANGTEFMHRLTMDAPLAEGLYTLTVLSEGEQIQQRFIVNR